MYDILGGSRIYEKISFMHFDILTFSKKLEFRFTKHLNCIDLIESWIITERPEQLEDYDTIK